MDKSESQMADVDFVFDLPILAIPRKKRSASVQKRRSPSRRPGDTAQRLRAGMEGGESARPEQSSLPPSDAIRGGAGPILMWQDPASSGRDAVGSRVQYAGGSAFVSEQDSAAWAGQADELKNFGNAACQREGVSSNEWNGVRGSLMRQAALIIEVSRGGPDGVVVLSDRHGRLDALAMFEHRAIDLENRVGVPVGGHAHDTWRMELMMTAPKNNLFAKKFMTQRMLAEVDGGAVWAIGFRVARIALNHHVAVSFLPANSTAARLFRSVGAVPASQPGSATMVWTQEAMQAFIAGYGSPEPELMEIESVFDMPIFAMPEIGRGNSRGHDGPDIHPDTGRRQSTNNAGGQ